MELRTSYQRSQAAVELAELIRDNSNGVMWERAHAIITLLAAPANIRKAAEPEILKMLGRPTRAERAIKEHLTNGA
jgi:hypothetical protein